MSRFKTFVDSNALILSMIIGIIGYPLFRSLMPLLPPLIFLMLFFTFCKVNPIDLRLHTWHWLVLVIQLTLAIGVYYSIVALCRRFSLNADCTAGLAQGIMVCVIMPTATAAPIIAGKLGGSIQNLTTFTLLSNIATAIVVPAFFPIANSTANISFVVASLLILRKVGPLLLGPFFAAWGLRLAYNAYYRRHGKNRTFALSHSWASMPFYLWAATIIILMADITHTLLTAHYDSFTLIGLCFGSLAACLLQFWIGKRIGFHFPAPSIGEDYREEAINPDQVSYDMPSVSRITAGQALGQKNTTLGVWMAQTYLTPLAAIGPAAYIIWQNLFNSLQLILMGRTNHSKSHTAP